MPYPLPADCALQQAGGAVLTARTLIASVSAQAHAHEVQEGGWLLRSSTVTSDRIDPGTASRYGIEASSSRAVLSVVLLHQERPQQAASTAAAALRVVVRSLAGVDREIPLKEVRENGRISYLGSYEFSPTEALEIEITARHLGWPGAPPVELAYCERMWTRR